MGMCLIPLLSGESPFPSHLGGDKLSKDGKEDSEESNYRFKIVNINYNYQECALEKNEHY